MKSSVIWIMVTAGILVLSGCGGGGGHQTSKVCEMNVPEWTDNTMAISSIEDAKKALTPIMMVMDRQIGEESPSSVKIDKKVEKFEASSDMPDELKRLYRHLSSGDWLVEGLQKHPDALFSKSLREQANGKRECDYGGEVEYLSDNGGDANRTWQYLRLRFKKCVVATETIEGMLNQLLSSTPVVVNTLSVEESEEPNSTVTLNGLLELNVSKPNTGPGYFIIASNSSGKPTQESNATFADFAARNFTADLLDRSDPQNPIKGYLGANLNMALWIDKTATGETDIDLGVETTGCAALRMSVGGQQFVNTNFTADKTSVEFNRTRVDEDTVHFSARFDGYAGVDGMFDPLMIVSKPAEEENGLGIFQYYGEDFQVDALYHEDLNQNDITISGAFGTTCMGGVADYNASFVEYFDEDGWLAAVNGEILLNSGEAVLTMENQTTFTLTVGEQEETGSGPWPFIDDNCSNSFNIFGLLLDNFVGY